MLRGHQPTTIEEFNGLWRRGDKDSTPPDHFADCNNIAYIQSGFKNRDGINPNGAYGKVKRIYTYTKQSSQSLLVLNDDGKIFDTAYGPSHAEILSVSNMTDFAMISIAGRAYITPHDGELGLNGESVYVYKGDGTTARKAGGAGPATAPVVADSGAAGDVESGIHIFGVVYETDTGFLTKISPGVQLNASGGLKADLTSIPISGDSFVVARRIVATAAIDPALFTGDLTGYQFFFVPGGRIADNTTTTLAVSFFDSELLDDAGHLLDLFTNIPAGVNLTTYHGRLISVAEHDNKSLARVSYPGEPEAVDQVSGLIIAPLDGNPLTNCQAFRDVLYLFKKNRTIGYPDNGDVPSSWANTVVDEGIGAPIHGVATVLDSGGVNVDSLLIADFSGIMNFTGNYERPELSWKVKDLWFALSRDNFNRIQIYNDTINQIMYALLPDGTMLVGDYSNGFNYKDIRWSPWTFDVNITSFTIQSFNTLVLASDGLR